MHACIKGVSLGLMCLLVLTGCEPKDEALTNPGAVGGTNGIARLQIWTTEAPEFFTALAREYVASVGATNLRFNVVNFANETELKEFLVDQMAAGAGPDVIYIDGSWVARNTNKLVPVSGDDSFNPVNFRNTFVQSAQSLLVKNEQIWGVPLGVDSLALYYNDAHVQDRLPNRNIPGRTWEEFQEDVIALTKTDNSFSRFAFSAAALGRVDNVSYGLEVLENVLLQSGVQWFSGDGEEVQLDKTLGLVGGRNQNLGEQALDFFTSFADDRFRHYTWNEFVAPAGQPWADYKEFLRGNVTMVFGYSRDLDRLKLLRTELQQKRQTVIPENDIRVTFLPQINDPSSTPVRQVVGKVYSLAVSRHSEFPDIAWDFLKFAITKDNLQTWHEKTKLPTPRLDLLTEQEATPFLGIFVRQAKFAEGLDLALEPSLIDTQLAGAVEAIESRQTTVLQALQKAGQNLESLLRERNRKLREIGG